MLTVTYYTHCFWSLSLNWVNCFAIFCVKKMMYLRLRQELLVVLISGVRLSKWRFKFWDQIFSRKWTSCTSRLAWGGMECHYCSTVFQLSFSWFQTESVVHGPVRNNYAVNADTEDDDLESRDVIGHHVVRRNIENGQVEASSMPKSQRLTTNPTAKPDKHSKRRHCKRKRQDKCGNTNADQVTSLLIH